jgi:hypothetical protein
MELYMMKFLKPVAIGACALVALAVGVSSATAGQPAKVETALKMQKVVGACDDGDANTPLAPNGAVSIAKGVANLSVPEQYSWAQIRTFPEALQLKDLTTLKFDSNASDPGVAYVKIVTDHGSVLYSPNTQPGGEQGLGNSFPTQDVLGPDATVRWQDDAGMSPDISWDAMLGLAGDATVQQVRFTAGCANPVGDDGAQVKYDNLTINNQEVIDFNKNGR